MSGFSGSPVFSKMNGKDSLVGMLYGSNETTIVKHSFTDIDEDGHKYSETTGHIHEFGLFHSCEDMRLWWSELFPTP